MTTAESLRFFSLSVLLWGRCSALSSDFLMMLMLMLKDEWSADRHNIHVIRLRDWERCEMCGGGVWIWSQSILLMDFGLRWTTSPTPFYYVNLVFSFPIQKSLCSLSTSYSYVFFFLGSPPPPLRLRESLISRQDPILAWLGLVSPESKGNREQVHSTDGPPCLLRTQNQTIMKMRMRTRWSVVPLSTGSRNTYIGKEKEPDSTFSILGRFTISGFAYTHGFTVWGIPGF
jgi:hypothetical protein